MASKRKQDEKHLNLLRGMAKLDHNKQCIDCNQRGPTYLNMTIGAFVCTSCSGLLRGLNPPHRVKSISMASFTPEEIEYVRSRGNEFCRKVWLGLHDSRNIDFLDKDENKIKDFMVLKYEKKRYYVAPTETMMEEARQQNTPPKSEPQTKPLRSLGNIPSLSVQNQTGQQGSSSSSHSAGQPASSISTPQLSAQQMQVSRPSTQHMAPQPPTAAAAAKKDGINLLDELGGDPFTGSSTTQQQGFADFGAFGAQPSQPPMPHSISQPTGFPPTNAMGAGMLSPMGSAPVASPTSGTVTQSNSFGAFSSTPQSSAAVSGAAAVNQQQAGTGSDKYSALAELDSVFAVNTNPKTVNWDGTVTGGSSSGGSVFGGSSNSGFGNTGIQTTNTAAFSSDTVYDTQTVQNPFNPFRSQNPFGSSNSSQMNATNPGMTVNPFSSAAPSFGQPPPSYNSVQSGGFGQMSTATNSNNISAGGFGQFGGTNTTASNVGGAQFGMAGGLSNGNMAPQQQPQMWGMAAQPAQQGQVNAFGGGMNFGGSGMAGGTSGAAVGGFGGKQAFPGQTPAQQFGGGAGGGGWNGAQQPAANPFMNIANQQVNRPLNSTNPFL